MRAALRWDLLAVRPEGRLFFADARRVVDHIAAIAAGREPPPRVVLLDLGAVNDLEVTGRTDLEADTGRLGVRVFPSVADAVAAYQEPGITRPG